MKNQHKKIYLSGHFISSQQRLDIALSTLPGIGVSTAQKVVCQLLAIERTGDFVSQIPTWEQLNAQQQAQLTTDIFAPQMGDLNVALTRQGNADRQWCLARAQQLTQKAQRA